MLKAKAVITTRYKGQVYKPVEVQSVLEAYVDGAMDTDADQWNFTIADPAMDFINTLGRDNEVRASLYVVGTKRIEALHTGFADEIAIDHENTLSFTGRDITAVAADSACPPAHWELVRPEKLIAKQARMLKIGDRLHLSKGRMHRKFFTDGGETYWEVWNRFYRKSQQWIWAEPDGAIIASSLKYQAQPVYNFGEPIQGRRSWIQVERAEWRKDTTRRFGEIFVFGHRGDVGFVARATDPTTRRWIKRPTRIVNNPKLRNQREALTEAWEEIFESKVGSVEWRLIVADPGFRIKQNRMAYVHLPSIGLRGNFFVVGVRLIIGASGLFQEVRLRERGYALSRRVPDDPQIRESPSDDRVDAISGKLGNFRWGQFFSEAAKKHHGPWDFKLFLACMLAMCGEKESGFQNKRESGSTEWYQPPSIVVNPAKAREHMRQFANNAENPDSPFHPGRETGVGPMQLTTRSYKDKADKLGKISDEFVGGRWNPRWNIMVAAEVLRSKLQTSGAEQNPSPENIWIGVKAYNGAGPAAEQYARDIRRAVEEEYLLAVEGALEAAKEQQESGADIDPGQMVYPLAVKHKGSPEYPMGGIAAHHQNNPGRNNWQTMDAVDLGVPYGTRVFAMFVGVISPRGTAFDGYGASNSGDPKLAGLRFHLVSEDETLFYTHLSRLSVTPGQKVEVGQLLGYSGKANGAEHLHIAALNGNIERMVRESNFYDEARGKKSSQGGKR